jgi:hypothetical protein
MLICFPVVDMPLLCFGRAKISIFTGNSQWILLSLRPTLEIYYGNIQTKSFKRGFNA